MVLVVKNPPANDLRDMGLISGSGRSPGELGLGLRDGSYGIASDGELQMKLH